MIEFFPGSKRQLGTPPPGWKLVQVEEVDLGPSRTFQVNGTDTELYGMGSIAAALNRKPVTIRKWEAEGIVPKPNVHTGLHDNRAKRRWYTKDQILGLRKLADEEGILYPSANGKWKAVESTDFKTRSLQLFKELEKNWL